MGNSSNVASAFGSEVRTANSRHHHLRMKDVFARTGWYAILGIFAVPFSIVSHELGHYLAYIRFGAEEVILRSASVAANKTSLNGWQIAFATAVGPLITYATILIAGILVRYRYHAVFILLGLAAPLGRVVNVVYVYLRFAGYQPNPNFDEFNFAKAVGFDPLFVAVPTVIAVLVTLIYFCRIAWKKSGLPEILSAIIGVVVGLLVWFQVGPLIFP